MKLRNPGCPALFFDDKTHIPYLVAQERQLGTGATRHCLSTALKMEQCVFQVNV